MLSYVWIGVAIGAPLFGWWSNVIQQRCLPLILASILGLISSLAIIYMPVSHSQLVLLLICYGAAASSMTVTFGLVQDLTPKKVAGTAVGFNNMAIIAGGISAQPAAAFLLHYSHPSTTSYTSTDFQNAFVLIPAIFLIGIITSAFFLKETYCKSQHEASS